MADPVWLILYDDESTFSNLDGAPYEAPRTGVQMVFRRDERAGVAVEDSPHGYWVWDGVWLGVDPAGFWDHLFHHPTPPLVIFGRYVRDEEWEGRIQERIRQEMNTHKSAWRKRERLVP